MLFKKRALSRFCFAHILALSIFETYSLLFALSTFSWEFNFDTLTFSVLRCLTSFISFSYHRAFIARTDSKSAIQTFAFSDSGDHSVAFLKFAEKCDNSTTTAETLDDRKKSWACSTFLVTFAGTFCFFVRNSYYKSKSSASHPHVVGFATHDAIEDPVVIVIFVLQEAVDIAICTWR